MLQLMRPGLGVSQYSLKPLRKPSPIDGGSGLRREYQSPGIAPDSGFSRSKDCLPLWIRRDSRKTSGSLRVRRLFSVLGSTNTNLPSCFWSAPFTLSVPASRLTSVQRRPRASPWRNPTARATVYKEFQPVPSYCR